MNLVGAWKGANWSLGYFQQCPFINRWSFLELWSGLNQHIVGIGLAKVWGLNLSRSWHSTICCWIMPTYVCAVVFEVVEYIIDMYSHSIFKTHLIVYIICFMYNLTSKSFSTSPVMLVHLSCISLPVFGHLPYWLLMHVLYCIHLFISAVFRCSLHVLWGIIIIIIIIIMIIISISISIIITIITIIILIPPSSCFFVPNHPETSFLTEANLVPASVAFVLCSQVMAWALPLGFRWWMFWWRPAV